uniref:Non-structural maintenance of chromosomes element 4 n=1 Tax=Pinguiococcus pyrenoidosus TaxID=172671 RepID=A0A7R9U9Z9_9STRA|mmetsp:Transcript_18467/g.69873  ORF Transcript_18467/g.69873 Transcript_18467/m.69873 type:complete len:390 (+) Transcript_18467:76-1245(+)
MATRKRIRSDAGRRQLRLKQRALHKELIDSIDDNPDVTLDSIRALKEKNNALFNDVDRPREAVLDVSNMHVIAKATAKQVDGLRAGVLSFDAGAFLNALEAQIGKNGGADWYKLGLACQGYFAGIPDVSFMHGGLGREARERKQSARSAAHKKAKLVASVTSQQMKTDKDKEGEDATSVRIHALGTLLGDTCEDTNEASVSMFDFLVNPRDFTQTVENLFDYAFLVKDGKAGVQLGQQGLPECSLVERDTELNETARKSHSSARTQNIVSINLKAFRDIVDAHSITETAVPHRDRPQLADELEEWTRTQQEAAEREAAATAGAASPSEQAPSLPPRSRKASTSHRRLSAQPQDDDDQGDFEDDDEEEDEIEVSAAKRRRVKSEASRTSL